MTALLTFLRWYAIGFVGLALAASLVGSFVLWDWWTPFETVSWRAGLAWMTLVPGVGMALVRHAP